MYNKRSGNRYRLRAEKFSEFLDSSLIGVGHIFNNGGYFHRSDSQISSQDIVSSQNMITSFLNSSNTHLINLEEQLNYQED